MLFRSGLKGKVAIVTGSGRGIGATTAAAFAAEGAKVVVTDIDAGNAERSADALRGAGYAAIGVAADVTKSADVERLMAATMDAFGALHVLVNNAGFPKDNYITRMPEADFDAVVNVALKGCYLCSKAAVPPMMNQRWGRIINVSSRAWLGNPGQSN